MRVLMNVSCRFCLPTQLFGLRKGCSTGLSGDSSSLVARGSRTGQTELWGCSWGPSPPQGTAERAIAARAGVGALSSNDLRDLPPASPRGGQHGGPAWGFMQLPADFFSIASLFEAGRSPRFVASAKESFTGHIVRLGLCSGP